MSEKPPCEQRVSPLFGRALPARPDFAPPRTADTTRPNEQRVAQTKPRRPTIEETEALVPEKSFLIVDDVRCTCEVITTLLRAVGAQSHLLYTATTLFGAMQILRDNRIDVVISDLNLQMGTGLDLLTAMQRGGVAPDASFMLVTNDPEAAEIHKAKALGVASVLLKPLSIGNILEHLSYVIKPNVLVNIEPAKDVS